MFNLVTVAVATILLVTPQVPPGITLDAREPIPYFIEDGKGISGYRDSDRELAKLALDAWSRESGGRLKFTEVKAAQMGIVRFRWIPQNEGLYGEMQRVQVNGKRGAIVNVMPEVAVHGDPLASRALQDSLLRDTIVYLTCVHELGHAVGLQHTSRFDDIMYYFGYGGDIVNYFMRYRTKLQSRSDIAKYSGLSSSDIEILRAMYRN